MKKPTEEGLRRYPPDGMYEDRPCTCTECCPPACKGECGCYACASAYCDAMEEYY